ncbi:MAG: hypothetical protein ACYC09_01005 [Bacteroidota bacterium]
MLIVRDIFTAKPGQASKLAKLCKKTFGVESNVRVMTDFVAEFNTVVVETEIQKLAEFERHMEEHASGKPEPRIDPKTMEELSKYTDMYVTGRREIFRIIE